MSHISFFVRRQRLHLVTLSMLALVLGFTSAAPAALFDFQPVSGDYNVAGNWLDYTNSVSGVPTEFDAALVRNGNTLNITAADGNATAAVFRIGAGPQTAANPEGVDPAGPPTYGGAGTLNWTGGEILGAATGPRIYVGERDDVNNINYTGIVNQSGGKVSLNQPTSAGAALIVGFSGATSTPTSVYNLMPGGTIGVTAGANNNDGIRIRNGTFNMTGGDIVSDDGVMSAAQRAITIANGSGGTLGNESVAYANFSGGTVYTFGGMRIAGQSHTKGYVNISGTADLHFRAVDVQLGTNATNSYAQVDMSAGSFKVGDLFVIQDRRLIIGDSGTGVFNLSGGAVHLEHSLVVGNNFSSKGTLHQTGGTLRVRSIETNRNTSPNWDLTTENATILIDGPTAVFNQLPNDIGTTGTVSIGQFGKGRFEVRQGVATLTGEVRLSQNNTSRATLAVTGGKLRIEHSVTRLTMVNTPAAGDFNNNGLVDAPDYALWKKNQNTGNALPNDNGLGTPVGAAHYDLWRANFGNVKQDNTPNIILTGGELELAPFLNPNAMSWQTNMKLEGTDFDPKPGAVMLTNVGSYPNKPANFSLNAGSVWDLNIASNTTLGGADWVDVPNSCNLANACDVTPGATFAPTTFNGGSINIIPISGYTPAFGDTLTIVRNALGGVILGSVSISNPNWVLQTNPGSTEIQLRYSGPGSGSSLAGSAVPEPSTIVLVGLFASASLAWRPARYRKRYGALCMVDSQTERTAKW